MNDNCLIGIVGNWSNLNYGAQLTYYALYQTMIDEGYSVVMIEGCEDSLVEGEELSPKLFRDNPYKPDSLIKIKKNQADFLNESIDTFIVGSDQLWRYIFFKKSIDVNLLSFANSNKRKISYATSFGENEIVAPKEHLMKMGFFLKRFQKISVREWSGIEICKKNFGISDVECVLDPVFLCDKKNYEKMIEKSTIKQAEDFVFVYVVHPSVCKRDKIKIIVDKFGKKVIWVRNPRREDYDGWNVSFAQECKLEEWLYYIQNADCIITDSFHACCFSIIFKKMFIPIFETTNGLDSIERLSSLTYMLKMETPVTLECMPEDYSIWSKKIDYEVIDSKLRLEKERSKKWLKEAINEEVSCDKTDLLWDVLRPQVHRVCYLEKTLLEQRRELNILKYSTRNLILFGAGNVLEKNLCEICKIVNIHSIVDNNANKWGRMYMGIECISPKTLKNIENPHVIITIENKEVIDDVREQLYSMGIDDISVLVEWIEII